MNPSYYAHSLNHMSVCVCMCVCVCVCVCVRSRSCFPTLHPQRASSGCKWRTRWTSAREHCCCCPRLPTQTAFVDPSATRKPRPAWDTGPAVAAGTPGGIFDGSCGLSKSRRCSWGTRWRWAATPQQTLSTLARCCLRQLWTKRDNSAHS